MDFLRACLFSLSSFVIIGCQIPYLLKSAKGQLSLINHRIPLEQALQDPELSPQDKEKIRLVQKVKEFAQNDLGLKKSQNYTRFVKLDRPYVTYVVSASPQWELKHHLWDFPFVGQMPYKGFFSEEDAKDEESSLQKEKLDTYFRGVSAYSTLGWFDDPLLSSMLRMKSYDLVDTIIHETVHTTLYIKNSADFNERLATFVGGKGAELFYLKEEGPQSKTLQQMRQENEDEKIFSEFISREIRDLEKWYKEQKDKTEERRLQRIKDIQRDFKSEVAGKMKTDLYAKFPELNLNNARLLLYKTYLQDLSDFEKLYELSGKNIAHFMAHCQSLQSHKKPEEGLKELLTTLQ